MIEEKNPTIETKAGTQGGPERFPDAFSDAELRRFVNTKRGFIMGLVGIGVGGEIVAHNVTSALAATKPSQAFVEILAEFQKEPRPSFEELRALCGQKAMAGELSSSEILTLKGMLVKIQKGEKIQVEEPKKVLTSEERKLERLLQELNGSLGNYRNWLVATDRTDSAIITRGPSGQGISIKLIEKGHFEGGMRNGGARFTAQLPSGKYNLEISSAPEGYLRMYLYDSGGNELNQDGSIAQKGKGRVDLKNGINRISIPKNCTGIGFFATVTPANPKLEIGKINLSVAGDILAVAGEIKK